jgi:hypothetical protein
MSHVAPEPIETQPAIADSAAIHADAWDRAKRTLKTGLLLDILVAVGFALSAWLADASDNDIPTVVAVTGLAVSLGKSVLQAVASWLLRLKSTPQNTFDVKES